MPRDATVGGLEAVGGGAVVGDEGAEVLLGLAQRDGDVVPAEVGQGAAAGCGALVGAVDDLGLHSLGCEDGATGGPSVSLMAFSFLFSCPSTLTA